MSFSYDAVSKTFNQYRHPTELEQFEALLYPIKKDNPHVRLLYDNMETEARKRIEKHAT